MIKKQIIRKRSEFPKCIRQFKEVKGIYVGGCIDGLEAPKGTAHAHCVAGHHRTGWICLSYKYQLKEKLTLLHEVAHLIADKSVHAPDHGKKWRDIVESINGTYKSYACYSKRFYYRDYSPKKKK